MTKDYGDLAQWVQNYFLQQGQTAPGWQPLTGDAGFRRYFRLEPSPSQQTLLAVYAPPATEANHAFVAIASHLREYGLFAPQVLAVDYERGFLLVEDLGPNVYLPALTTQTAASLYGQAFNALLKLQLAPVDEQIFPPYDNARLTQEMALMPEWFVEQLLSYPLNPDERGLLQKSFALLAQEALKQPKRIVHRDFHSRNLITRGDQAHYLEPGLIDFQDALAGPITYDLVSLLRDCYIHWPRRQVEAWALHYRDLAEAAGIIPSLRDGEFLRWFDWMGLQRHLKVLGIFARLSLRDGKHHYLRDLPLVLAYVLSVARRYHEFSPLISWFETRLLPRVIAQPWYQPLSADL